LFFEPEPSAAGMPHLITILDGDLLGKVSHLTKSRPGLWPLPAPFDEADHYDEVRVAAKFADWGLPLNQAEVQGMGRLVKDALFGANLLIMSAAIDEALVGPLAQTHGQRLSNGAWFTPGYQDIPHLPQIVEAAGWVLIPLGPGRNRALFACARANAECVIKLQEWCARQGRDCWKVEGQAGNFSLGHLRAPAESRNNAIRHRIDAFLVDMELWFGDVSGELAPRVQQRIDDLRQLRDNITRAKATSND
jgi:hypothetical protein